MSLIQKLQSGGEAVAGREALCEGLYELPLPPGQIELDSLKQSQEAPASDAGSFLIEGYPESVSDRLQEYRYGARAEDDSYTFSANKSYEAYMRMHKVLVGKASSEHLVAIATELSYEAMPRYLSAGGWAAAEAALVDCDRPEEERLALLRVAEDCWERAARTQLNMNSGNKEYLMDHAAPYRSALDLATLPLLEGIIREDVRPEVCTAVFEDCLRIAEASTVQLTLAVAARDNEGIAAHVGFGYECNALLALNRYCSNRWFAIPTIARADSGYHYGQQTHDILVVRQKWGKIESIVPVEVKSHASLRDRQRYQALLVRGKMHLSYEEQHAPGITLKAIAAVHEGNATMQQQRTAEGVSRRFMNMLTDYYHGAPLQKNPRTKVAFHDNSLVVAKYPGLNPTAA